jgi:hypothetical protein
VRVVRALHTDVEEARAEARDLHVPFLLVAGALERVEGVAADDGERVALAALLRGGDAAGGDA